MQTVCGINVNVISSFVHISMFRDEGLSLGGGGERSAETLAPNYTFSTFFSTQIVCASFTHKCARYFVVRAQSLPHYLQSRKLRLNMCDLPGIRTLIPIGIRPHGSLPRTTFYKENGYYCQLE